MSWIETFGTLIGASPELMQQKNDPTETNHEDMHLNIGNKKRIFHG